MIQPAPSIEMNRITRRFANTMANDQVSLRVKAGTVHALVGENGAGKSTLMKILGGLDRPDSGEILINGEKVVFQSPTDATRAGIGMVHQHFMLIPPFTVAENVVLGIEDGAMMHHRKIEKHVGEVAAQYRIQVDPRARVRDLGVGLQQRVEILKVLYRKARIIILDEPTAVLTPKEVDELFVTIRELKQSGATIIIITHKLREVLSLSDHCTVLRGGRHIASLATADTSAEEIAHLMVGRDITLPTLAGEIKSQGGSAPINPSSSPESVPARPQPRIDPLAPTRRALEVRSLSTRRLQHRVALEEISMYVRGGEIFGIAGVEGNGQTELVEALTGLIPVHHGSILTQGKEITRFSTRRRFDAGLACVHEDRQRHGLILDFTLKENLLLGRHHHRNDGARDLKGEGARQMLETYDVRPPDPKARARALSGGNQQKVIIAREISRRPAVLIVSQPTRGVDLGAIEFIHKRLLELRSQGVAILLISAELTELMALSDRIAVMYGGRIVFSADNHDLTEHELGFYMAGGVDKPASASEELPSVMRP